ncbi:hypothetical protein I8752_24410 [Nostocaceae cyanobacterium CENA369]|uniref:Uncharacterized protein n=1 Tax=Dendronalium phyllosphericum CENA369 TaxID=1725256 RepID=A0A8J7I8B4_9NOST|nr:hypothetical protein [Dendronalium phyllosphericum]MBH8576078.1 hypothetical protein [Dendronalium phyllosphericum CENA369]
MPNFLRPSTQSIAAHLSPVEKIRYLHILKLQHHAAKLTSIAHLLQQRSPAASKGEKCF